MCDWLPQVSRGRDPNNIVVVWKKPHERFSDSCVVAICRTPPAKDETPENSLNIVMQQTFLLGESPPHELCDVNHEWVGMYIAVWAVIRFSKVTIYSEPLLLKATVPPAAEPPEEVEGKLQGLVRRVADWLSR